MAGELDRDQIDTGAFDEAFPIERVEEPQQKEKKRIYWKDIIAREEAKERGETVEPE